MRRIKILVGVPGSGKSWISDQVKSRHLHVPHDAYDQKDYADQLIQAHQSAPDRSVLAEAPFAVADLQGRLEDAGIPYETYYVDESEEVIRARYESRSNRAIPKMHLNNRRRYAAREWDHRGSSEEIRDLLSE